MPHSFERQAFALDTFFFFLGALFCFGSSRFALCLLRRLLLEPGFVLLAWGVALLAPV